VWPPPHKYVDVHVFHVSPIPDIVVVRAHPILISCSGWAHEFCQTDGAYVPCPPTSCALAVHSPRRGSAILVFEPRSSIMCRDVLHKLQNVNILKDRD